MNYLWSPWRMDYLQQGKKESCIFCVALLTPDGPENLIVARASQSYVILNRYPYTSGHLMVVPLSHESSLEHLVRSARAEMMELATRAMHVLGSEYDPQGFNLGVNVGEAAGAGIADHVHMHVVPRWNGDTNFMSSISQTRVLPEMLEDTYWRVRKAWEQSRDDS